MRNLQLTDAYQQTMRRSCFYELHEREGENAYPDAPIFMGHTDSDAEFAQSCGEYMRAEIPHIDKVYLSPTLAGFKRERIEFEEGNGSVI